MLIFEIYTVVMFLFALFTTQEFADIAERAVRMILYVLIVPFVIAYAFVVPYKGPAYIEENF